MAGEKGGGEGKEFPRRKELPTSGAGRAGGRFWAESGRCPHSRSGVNPTPGSVGAGEGAGASLVRKKGAGTGRGQWEGAERDSGNKKGEGHKEAAPRGCRHYGGILPCSLGRGGSPCLPLGVSHRRFRCRTQPGGLGTGGLPRRMRNGLWFLYALPRKEGYEFFVGQWSGTELHFTSLINVQTQGENAPSQLVLYHYPDLQKEKGIVLMTAEMDSKFLVVQDAQCLANQVQLFYATDRSETYALVETFNHRSNEFKYMSVIAELEQSGLGREPRPGQASHKS